MKKRTTNQDIGILADIAPGVCLDNALKGTARIEFLRRDHFLQLFLGETAGRRSAEWTGYIEEAALRDATDWVV